MPHNYYAYVSFLNLPFLLRDNYLRKGLSNPFGEIILSTHLRRLVREEVAGLERIQDLGNLELLALRLPELVGSPLSINALREDLQLSHKTVDSWLKVLERLYAIFRLPPFGAPRIRAVKKEQKHYHFDWSLVPSEPARFENLIASHLLKWVHFEQDARGRDIELRYFRDTDGREVDFVVAERRHPQLFVECKWGDTDVCHAGKL